jgi:hypothetical protein
VEEMTISYLLAPNPKWYIADNYGRSLGGGSLYTYRSLNPTQFKPTFQDPAGHYPWTDPILFDANGSQGPIYWEVDSLNPDETYFIEVYDAHGNLQWTIDNFSPNAGGGGGSIITEVNSIENLITNNVMYRNIGAIASPMPIFAVIAPSNHDGFATTPANAGPDIIFFKTNASATDTLTFMPFLPLGIPALTPDVTPGEYLNYTCSVAGSAELNKCVQFPITRGVQNLSNTEVTVTIWARSNLGTPNLTLQWYQFYGDGSAATLSVPFPIATPALTSGWVQYVYQSVIPSVVGNTVGQCGNSGLFLQVQYPLDAICNIDFTKPSVYLGEFAPMEDYSTHDVNAAIFDSPRTGDVRISINTFYPFGWLLMDDGSIGSASSMATNRANIDTFPLYNMLWNNVSQAYAPVTGGRGASAIIDFVANKPIYLIKALGRVFAGTLPTQVTQTFTNTYPTSTTVISVASTTTLQNGDPVVLTTTGTLPAGLLTTITYYVINLTTTTLSLSLTPGGAAVAFGSAGTGVQSISVAPYLVGQYTGVERTLDIPPHSHTVAGTVFAQTTAGALGSGAVCFTVQQASGAIVQNPNLLSGNTGVTGSGVGQNILQPTTYMNFFIKL